MSKLKKSCIALLAVLVCVICGLTAVLTYFGTSSQENTVTAKAANSPAVGSTMSSEDYYRLLYVNGIEADGAVSQTVGSTNLTAEEMEKFECNTDNMIVEYVVGLAASALTSVPQLKPLAKIVKNAARSGSVKKLDQNITKQITALSDMVNTNIAKACENINENINVAVEDITASLHTQTQYLSDLFKSAQAQEKISAFCSAENGGFGYTAWKQDLSAKYKDLIDQQERGSNATDIKTAFDNLYVSAAKGTSLRNYIIGTSFVDKPIMDYFYDYFLVQTNGGTAMDENTKGCIALTEDLYQTYLFSQMCMSLCYNYISNYFEEHTTVGYYYLHDNTTTNVAPSQLKTYSENYGDYLDEVKGSLATFYAKILNVYESYSYQIDGVTTKLLYRAVADTNSYGLQAVTVADATKYFSVNNTGIVKGSTLYLNRIPEKLLLDMNMACSFRLKENVSGVSVNNNGVVTVNAESGTFTVQLVSDNDTVLYEMPFTIGSEFHGGKGTTAFPYLIGSLDDLKTLATNSSYWQQDYHFRLIADINVSGSDLAQIGNTSTSFSGVFDGNGHKIIGSPSSGKSLFFRTKGTIKNLTVTGANVTWFYRQQDPVAFAGGLTIDNYGTIENCTLVNSTINVTFKYQADFEQYWLWFGGICTNNYGTIRGCTVANNTITGYLMNYPATTSYDGTGYDKGLVGAIAGNSGSGTISDNCVFNNNITLTIHSTSFAYKKWPVTNNWLCVAVFEMGGIVGESTNTTITGNSYCNNTLIDRWAFETYHDGSDKNFQQSDVHKNDIVGVATNTTVTNNRKLSASPEIPTGAVSGITVVKQPNAMVYNIGDVFNPAGMILKTSADNYVSSGFTVEGFDNTKTGVQTVTIKYNGATTTLNVLVQCTHEHTTEEKSSEEKLCDCCKRVTTQVTCTDCNETIINSVSDVSIGGAVPSWGEWASTNATQHSRTCATCHKTINEAHMFATEGGKRVCSVCGYSADSTSEQPPVEDDPAQTGDAQFVADTVTGTANSTVKVKIRIENNPGIVCFQIKINYDSSVLTLIDSEDGAFNGLGYSQSYDANPYVVSWTDTLHGNNTTNGAIITLVFRVAEGAELGLSPITVTYNTVNVYDKDFNEVAFKTVSGGVNISDVKCADVNGDGDVNFKDYGLLQQYLNGWDVTLGG